jgi:hypothetical protein
MGISTLSYFVSGLVEEDKDDIEEDKKESGILI